MNSRSAAPTDEIRRELLSGAGGLACGARRLVRWRAVMLWLAVLFGALGLLMLGDMLLRREEIGLRVLSLMVWLGVSGLAAYRLLGPAWKFSPTPLQVTKWVEQSRPDLEERLSTAVQLAEVGPEETRFGSRQFRDAVLRSWMAETDKPVWNGYLDSSSWWRAAGTLLAVASLLFIAAAIWPSQSRLALARLAIPWSSHHWPRADRLVLNNPPQVIAIGSDLQLEVIDLKLPPPASIDLHVRQAGESDASGVATIPTKYVGDLAVGNVTGIEEAIEVRAVGGDDDTMPWHRIDVVTPPTLERFLFSIEPPAYSGRPPSELVGNRIQVLAGSRVSFSGSFDEPVSAVQVELEDGAGPRPGEEIPSEESSVAESAEDHRAWEASLGEGGRSLRIGGSGGQPQVLTRSLAWQLVVTTSGGLQIKQPDRWMVEVVADEVPVVMLNQPEMNEIAAGGRLALSGSAADDLGVAEVAACVEIDGAPDAELQRVVLWSAQPDGVDAAHSLPKEMPIDGDWDFTRELPAVEGKQVVLWLEARDALGQLGKSQTQRFRVLSAEDMLYSIENRQNQLLERVRELVEAQRHNWQLATRTNEILRQAKEVRQGEVDTLLSVAQTQQAISKQLAGDRLSIAEHIKSTKRLLSQNRLADSEIAGELQTLGRAVDRIAAGSMKSATTRATEALREVKTALNSDNGAIEPPLSDQLKESAQSQANVLREIQSLMDRMARNESLQQLQRELSQVLDRQQALRHDTDALQVRQLSGMSPDEMNASRTGLATDQQGLARQLDALIRRSRQLSEAAGDDQQALASRMDDVSDALVNQQASGMMRRATEQIAEEQFTLAATTQQQVAELLQDAIRELGAGGRETTAGDWDARSQQLREAEQEISALAGAQAALAEQLRTPTAATQTDELAKEQSRLRQATAAQAEQAEQAGDARSSAAVREATGAQGSAEKLARENRPAAAADAAQQAADKLQDVATEMGQRADRLDREVQQQQAFRLAADLEQIVAGQRPVVERLDALGQTNVAELGDAERQAREAEVRQVASRQEVVRQLVRDVRKRIDRLPAYDWVLEQTDVDMSRAVAAAQRSRIHPDALSAASDALDKLQLAAAALEPNPEEAGDAEEPTSDDGSGSQDSDRMPVPSLASLKLLRAFQQDINEQTLAVGSDRDAAQRLRELASQQQSLGEQLARLLQEIAASRTGEAE